MARFATGLALGLLIGQAPESRLREARVQEVLPIALLNCDAVLAPAICVRSLEQPVAIMIWFDESRSPIRESPTIVLDGSPLASDRYRVDIDERGMLIEFGDIPLRATLELRSNQAGARVEFEPRVARPLERRDCRLAQALDIFAIEQRAALADQLDDLRCAASIRAFSAYVTTQLAPDAAAAERQIAALRELGRHDVIAAGDADYFEGVLAARAGRHVDALSALDRAADLLSRSELSQGWLGAVQIEQAVTLAELGRFDEADRVADSALGHADAQIAADVRANLAWINLLRRDEDSSRPDPAPGLRELVGYYEHEDDRPRATSVRVNLAYALSRSDPGEARRVLASVDRRKLTTLESIFVEIALARIALAEGEDQAAFAEARAHLDRALALAQHQRGARLRVHFERADVELRAGRLLDARAQFEAGEQLADQLALDISAPAGRSSFSTARSRSRSQYVELLLALDDPAAALCSVLGARARHSRALATGYETLSDPGDRTRYFELLGEIHRLGAELDRRASQAWELSGEQLEVARLASAGIERERDVLLVEATGMLERSPANWRCERVRSADPKRALLTMIADVSQRGWYFLLDRADQVDVIHLPARPEESAAELAERALREFDRRGRLAALDQLAVVPTGRFTAVDFLALAWTRTAELEVVHSLALGSTPTIEGQGAVALLGRAGNLELARDEEREVAERMREVGWSVGSAWQPGAAVQPELLHYVGHGRHAGLVGWDSTLSLATGELGVGELIAEQRAPRVVVLAACAGGMTSPEAIDGGMNIATALLLAGAELVIAPDHVVEDELARELAIRLYRELAGPDRRHELGPRLVAALASAQRADPRFAGWRAWVR